MGTSCNSKSAITKLQGGRWSSGFWSGFASSFFSPGTKLGGEGTEGMTLRTVIAGTIGGTVSEITGGKFANGAVTGAFVHLFNAEGEKLIDRFKRAYTYAEDNYEKTMDATTVFGQNILEETTGALAIKVLNISHNSKNIFYKDPYYSNYYKAYKSTRAMSFIDKAVFRTFQPALYGVVAYKTGVAIGSGIVGVYKEFIK